MTYITEKYFSNKFKIRVVANFLVDIYYSQKSLELLSFIIWELKYQLGLYRKDEFVQFLNKQPLHVIHTINNISIKSDSFFILECRENWQLISSDKDGVFYGCTFGEPSILLMFTLDEIPVKCCEFGNKITNIFVDERNNVFICSGGTLFKSNNKGLNFREVLKFSSSTSYFRREAITENSKGELFIGEYANNKNGKKWEFVGYIYHSINNGDTWIKIDFLRRQGVNKHIHILKWSNLFQALILTDGDNKKSIWVNKSQNQFDKVSRIAEDGWRKINRFHLQKGGYTAIAEINNKIIFGTDYNGGSNFLVSTNNLRLFDAKVMPNPYRRAIIETIVVRLDKDKNQEVWVNLSFRHSKSVKSLLMFSTDNGIKWQKIIEYDGTLYEIDIICNSNNIRDKIYLLVQDRTKKVATTFCINNCRERVN